ENKLRVAVALPTTQGRELSGTLSVELLGPGGKALARADQAVRQKEPLASYGFDLPADKARADGLTLRCRLGARRFEVPLGKVLLVKPHETTLASGQEFFAGSTAPFRLAVHGARTVTETLPLPGAEVTVRLRDKDGKVHTLYSGKTDPAGR